MLVHGPAIHSNRTVCAFTLIETLVSIAILGLLISLLVPALGRARDGAKLASCASSMRSIGQAIFVFAGDHEDRLPVNIEPWNKSYPGGGRAISLGVSPQAEYNDFRWIEQIHGVLGMTASPWMAGLRCPTAALDYPVENTPPAGDDQPGSCWLLNFYCSGRVLSSIPNPSDGVLVHEGGLWAAMSEDTPMLAFPSQPWRYPHPSVGFTKVGPWKWLSGRRSRQRRNILWVDGHVAASLAKTWANGGDSHDRDRIRHMRFDRPGNHPLDP